MCEALLDGSSVSFFFFPNVIIILYAWNNIFLSLFHRQTYVHECINLCLSVRVRLYQNPTIM